MELNDSSTCLIHGQYTIARMGDAKNLTHGVGRKPYSKEAEGTIAAGCGWSSEVSALPEGSKSLSKRETREAS